MWTIYVISMTGLFEFLDAYFFNIRIEGVFFIKTFRAKKMFSIIIAVILSSTVYILLNEIIPLISDKQKI